MAERAHVEEIEAQAALFALGALTPEEGARFEQRIAAGCSLCRSELVECERTVTALPLTMTVGPVYWVVVSSFVTTYSPVPVVPRCCASPVNEPWMG